MTEERAVYDEWAGAPPPMTKEMTDLLERLAQAKARDYEYLGTWCGMDTYIDNSLPEGVAGQLLPKVDVIEVTPCP